MLKDSQAFSGFAVADLDAAREFYGSTLGLEVADVAPDMPLLALKLAGDGRDVFVYAKPDHAPANCTILNFPVSDIDATVDALVERGVTMERYDGFDQDEKGIARGDGPSIAWFKDPSGNILSVLEMG
jgi:predicted enzyme related to lactoylglutathione lyase